MLLLVVVLLCLFHFIMSGTTSHGVADGVFDHLTPQANSAVATMLATLDNAEDESDSVCGNFDFATGPY